MTDDNIECDLTLSRTDIQTLPRLSVIQLPCFFRSIDSAVAHLGGHDRVAAALSDDADGEDSARLTFRFHTAGNNSLSTPLVAVPSMKNGVLVKLRRRKGTGEITAATPMGIIARHYSFPSPCDFQVSFSRFSCLFHLI